MSPLRARRLLVSALAAALLLAPAAVGAEPDADAGSAAEAGFEASHPPFLPAVVSERSEKRAAARHEEARRVELLAPAGLRAPEPQPAPARWRVAHAPRCARALERWCLSHSTSTASP